MIKFLREKKGRFAASLLAAAVFCMAFASSALAEEGEGAAASVDMSKMTEPITSEITSNTPALLAFIGGILAIGFVVGWGISLLRKGKRT